MRFTVFLQSLIEALHKLRMSDGEVPEWMQILGEEMIEEDGELKKEILPDEFRNRKWVLYDKEKSATEWSYEKILGHRRLNYI